MTVQQAPVGVFLLPTPLTLLPLIPHYGHPAKPLNLACLGSPNCGKLRHNTRMELQHQERRERPNV
jgi:hypothetical protein